MKNKGFTLVELLAVVAILAVMMVFLLPNALSAYRNSKKSVFVTDIQTIYKTAIDQAKADNVGSRRKAITYCRQNGDDCMVSGVTYESLDLSGSKDLDYMITIDRDSNVAFLAATNGIFEYYENKIIENVEQINEDDVISSYDSEEIQLFTIDQVLTAKSRGDAGQMAGNLNVSSSKGVTFDVYINGNKVANSVKQYNTQHLYGTKYKVVPFCNSSNYNIYTGVLVENGDKKVDALCE